MGLSLGKNCCPLKVLQGRCWISRKYCLRVDLGGSFVDFELVMIVELDGGRDSASVNNGKNMISRRIIRGNWG